MSGQIVFERLRHILWWELTAAPKFPIICFVMPSSIYLKLTRVIVDTPAPRRQQPLPWPWSGRSNLFLILAFLRRHYCQRDAEDNDYRDAILGGKAPCAKVLSSYTIKLINLVMMMVIMTSPQKNIYKGKWKIIGTLKHTQIDNSKLCSTQQQKICWHWHVARNISSQKTYGLYARKHDIVEMRGDVTDAGQTTKRTTEDRATQPMEAGGWVSQYRN